MPSVRRLTAILAADVAGYSRLMGADEEGTHARLRAHLHELIDPKIAEHHGRVVKNTGDGFLAEFPSVVDAVRCAVEVQRGMADRNAGNPPEKRIEFRVGINLGDVIVEGEDIFGDGVNVAARLEALAEPGGVCVSRVVRDQVRDKVDFAFEDRGDQSVKNIARPVRVYSLHAGGGARLPAPVDLAATPLRRHRRTAATSAVAGTALVMALAGWWLWPVAQPSPAPSITAATSISQPLVAPRLSIVVLPFTNLSNDPEQGYFADAITEDLTTDLSRFVDLLVISRNSAFTYKDKPVNAKQIGRELGVRYVLEGSTQRSGNQVRVSAQLIEAATDAHLWAERFDGNIGDLFALQNEITSRIASALNIELIGAEAGRESDKPDALDYILRGRATSAKPQSRANYSEAIDFYERALAIDPRSVRAQALLASTLVSRVLDGMSKSSAADIARADELITQILAASPRLAQAHFARAQLLRFQHRCPEAIPEYEAAIAFNRNWAPAVGHLGWCKFLTGLTEEPLPLIEQAIRLSPRDPNVAVRYGQLGLIHLLQSRTDEAILWFEKARGSNPALPYVHAHLASAQALKGQIELAAAELEEARRLSGDDRYYSVASVSRGYFGVPKVRALFERTYFAGLRKAGMPEE